MTHGTLIVLESLRRRIEVVAVQLDCKLAAVLAIDGYIPAAADAEIVSLWHNLYEPPRLLVVSGFHLVSDFIKNLASAVGRMIVDHEIGRASCRERVSSPV